MDEQAILVDRADGVATVTLNRPSVHNAFNDAVIAEMTGVLERLGADPALRVLVLRANGKSFSAGADLGWMQRMAGYSRDENLADARALARLMHVLDRVPVPTVALVQGAAFGGGVGLIACCDIAIAADTATFALTEVKLGIIPAVISPFVVQAIGVRAARRYLLSAERFDAAEAYRLGLVHRVVAPETLEEALADQLRRLFDCGPQAQREAKDLIFAVAHRPPADLAEETAARIARVRASAEGREGVGAFLERRKPAWQAGES
ncbi:MAG: enoyl-CoA hydratase/isomerase family protein [Rhodospirillaceae bacterium]|nr:enoyl-CoA hydratase/isomerase family protein [Rhodospirillaceae bacterium]